MTENPAAQLWFEQRKIPTVISGTRSAGCALPGVRLDSRALGRHAAGALLRYGHRRIGVVLTKSDPGLRIGLEETFETTAATAGVHFVEIDESASAVARSVDRMLALAQRPTAIFVASARPYLSVQTRLAQHGLRIPQDISLLCRDDETFLEALLPTAARYTKNPHLYAKKLHDVFVRSIESPPANHEEVSIMPEFVPADSLRRLTGL